MFVFNFNVPEMSVTNYFKKYRLQFNESHLYNVRQKLIESTDKSIMKELQLPFNKVFIGKYIF